MEIEHPREREWPRLDLPNVLWFFGAITAAITSIAVLDKVPESNADVWLLLGEVPCVAGDEQRSFAPGGSPDDGVGKANSVLPAKEQCGLGNLPVQRDLAEPPQEGPQ